MKQWKTIALALCCALFVSSFKSAHEYYVSVGEMSLNSETHQLEFALRIFTDDLEYALAKNGHEGVDVLNDPTAARLVERYVLDHFILRTEDGAYCRLFILGMEGDADAVDVYLETRSKTRIEGEIDLVYSVLLDVYPSQINILHYSNPNEPSSYRFEMDDDLQTIEL